MKEVSGFWDSIEPTPGNAGDERAYDAQDVAVPFAYLVTDGVQTSTDGTGLQVIPVNNIARTTRVKPGFAWINGHWYKLFDDGTGDETANTMQHEAPLSGRQRYDRIVLRYNGNQTLDGRYITLAIKKGTEVTANPQRPELTRENGINGIYELSLASVLITSTQTYVVESNITDERGTTSLCGYAEFAPEPNLQPKVNELSTKIDALYAGAEANAQTKSDEFGQELLRILEQTTVDGVTASMIDATAPTGQSSWTTVQKYLDGLHAKAGLSLSLTIPTTGWSVSRPYTATISAVGVTSDMLMAFVPQWSVTESTRQNERRAWDCVTMMQTGTNQIIVTCDNAKPQQTIKFIAKEVI